jgi:RimJ/RimL family protein N-acetyltransferase
METEMAKLETERLILRNWIDEDHAPFAALNADPDVMEFFPSTLTKDQSNSMVDRVRGLIDEKGYGFWACEEKLSGQFIGFVGLNNPEYELPFNPCLEIGWRLAKPYWGKGYASEAAKTALQYAFQTLDAAEVVSFTAVINERSSAVMKRLGFLNSNENFKHSALADGHPLQEHVLYKMQRSDFC